MSFLFIFWIIPGLLNIYSNCLLVLLINYIAKEKFYFLAWENKFIRKGNILTNYFISTKFKLFLFL